MNKIKEAKRMNVGDVIEIDGNFFEIKKTIAKNGVYNTEYTRYTLSVIVKKEKMDKLYKFLEDTGRINQFVPDALDEEVKK